MEVKRTFSGGKVQCMRILLALFLLVLAADGALSAAPKSKAANDQIRSDVREAVQQHRASQKDDIRRADAQAGRHLTAAERAQLREQLRQEWATPRPSQVSSSVSSAPPLRRVSAPTLDNVRASGAIELPHSQLP